MYLAHSPVITVNKICKTYDVLRSKCSGTIGDSKHARRSPYDGTEPVAYLGFLFGGLFKIFLEKWGHLNGAKRHV